MSEDLMTKFDELVKLVQSERAKMKAEVEAYNAEKERMNAVQVSDDDIIQLNVGGQKMTTTRSTLCQVEGSLLASMFSGRWEDGVSRDKDGCVFFDFNPRNFCFILDYLRAKRFAGPENPAPLPKVPEEQVENFNNLVEYLGLSDEIVPRSEVVSDDVFNLRSGVTLEEGGKVAVHGPSGSHQYVLGENVYQVGMARLKLKLESFKDNHWMFVGIVKGDYAPRDNNSFFWSASYGWGLGNNGSQGMYINGSLTTDNTLKNLSKQGDTVELVLDCDTGKVSLHLPTGQQFHIDIPKSQTWRLHVNLHGANDKIRILDQ